MRLKFLNISNVQEFNFLFFFFKSVFLDLKMESHRGKVFTLGMMTPELNNKKITA